MAGPDANHETGGKAPSGRPPHASTASAAKAPCGLHRPPPRVLLSRSASMPRMQSLDQLLNS